MYKVKLDCQFLLKIFQKEIAVKFAKKCKQKWIIGSLVEGN